jgi:hypothetical protein
MEFVGLLVTYAECCDPHALLEKYGLTWKQVAEAARRAVSRRAATATP